MNLHVCDDDEAIGAFFRTVYASEGWTVTTTTSGEACIAEVGEAEPDVIVIDQVMPGLTGIETARLLRAGGYTKPIVLFSAYLAPELRAACKELNLMELSKIDTQAVVHVLDVFDRQVRRPD